MEPNRKHLILRMVLLAWDVSKANGELAVSKKVLREQIICHTKQYGGKAKVTDAEVKEVLKMKLQDIVEI
jgi:hypothetical protein